MTLRWSDEKPAQSHYAPMKKPATTTDSCRYHRGFRWVCSVQRTKWAQVGANRFKSSLPDGIAVCPCFPHGEPTAGDNGCNSNNIASVNKGESVFREVNGYGRPATVFALTVANLCCLLSRSRDGYRRGGVFWNEYHLKKHFPSGQRCWSPSCCTPAC